MSCWCGIFPAIATAEPTATSAVAEGESHDEAALLALVCGKYQANKQRLETWRGRIRVVDQRFSESGLETHVASSVDFALDRRQRKARWNWTVEERITINNGAEDVDVNGEVTNTIRKFLSYYRLGPIDKEEARSGHQTVLVALIQELGIDPHSDNFDPLYFFSAQIDDVPGLVTDLYKLRRSPDDDAFLVRREDRRVVLEATHAETTRRFYLDLSQGGNLIAYENSGRRSREVWRFRLVKLRGVWVPAEIDLRTQPTNSKEKWHRKITFVENVVNKPVEAAEFSLAALGAKKGDIVRDANTSIAYVFAGDPEAAPSFDENASSALQTEFDEELVVLMNFATWILLFLIVCLARRRPSLRTERGAN